MTRGCEIDSCGGSVRISDLGHGHTDRAWAEIDFDNLRHNVSALRREMPGRCGIMAVVKANAYGHGDTEVARFLNTLGVRSFAVATADEGIRLRKSGIKGEILILGFTSAERASELCRCRLSQTVADAGHAQELNRFGKPISVHIKVNTGMNRLGEDFSHVKEIASVFDCENLRVKGIFTHLCVSDSRDASDMAFTGEQIRNFNWLLEKLGDKHIRIPMVHMQSSYGVVNLPQVRCGCARVGIALYGVLSRPGEQTVLSPDLKPVLALKSRVSLVRTVSAGESVGYGRAFTAQRETKLAVVSIGYADGYPLSLSSGRGEVLIRGRRAPIVGRICMDQLTADVSEIPGIGRGDIVTLIGRDGEEEISAENTAENAGTITNELLSRLGGRLDRIYFDRQCTV